MGVIDDKILTLVDYMT